MRSSPISTSPPPSRQNERAAMTPRVIRLFGAATAALWLALPADAAGPFTPPPGCEGFMTVQLMNCTVGNYYRCANDPPGDSWSTYFDGEGPYFTSRIDSETRWMQSYDHIADEWDSLDAVAADHASFTTLLATGRDAFDFSTTSDRGETRRYVGHDRLTGERLRIDGVTLERTEFDVSAYDTQGNRLWRRTGGQFIHRDWRLFLADTETFENAAGEIFETTDTPVNFALPGEPGFLATEPQYGCDMMMTTAPGAPIHTAAFQGRP